jgi:hypothetical protein
MIVPALVLVVLSLSPEHEHGAIPVVVPSPAHITEPVWRHTSLGECPSNWLDATVCPVPIHFRTQHPLGAVVNRPSVWSDR